MMEEKEEFFGRAQTTAVFTKFNKRLDALETDIAFELARNSHMQTIIRSMANSPAQWDENCGINISWIGDQFVSRISDSSEELTKEKLDDIYCMCFRFLFELYLSVKNDLSMEFERARKFASENIDEFEAHARLQIEYALRDMPINIFKSIANSDSIQSIKNFNALAQSVDTKRGEWEKELSAREKRVEVLKEALSTYETGFNFVGLFEGFNDLADKKNAEKDSLQFWLKVCGFIIVLPLITELIVLYSNLSDFEKVKNVLALSLLPTISLVAIFIYYFRVILHNYKSVKSQLLQIELRKTLCRFIQHYSEYSVSIKAKDKESLEKFENIIFSGIVADDEKLPSTFDGMEQLAKLFKTLKS